MADAPASAAPGDGTSGGSAVRGVALVAGATLSFALADVATKYLTDHLPVPLILALRYAVNLALLLAIYAPRHGLRLWRTERTGLVILRGLFLAAASITFALALAAMPVAETVAIVYLYPLLVMLMARPVLGERVGLIGWLAAALGFAGVLLIVRPGSGLATAGVVFALVNACLAASYQLLSRLLSRTESTMAMIVISAAVGTVVFGVQAGLTWQPVRPGPLAVAAVLALGGLAALGHFLFTAASREAPASTLAPVTYLHLFWSAGLGLVVFGQFPDRIGTLGILCVAAGGVLATLRAGRGRPQVSAGAAPSGRSSG